MPVTGAVVSLRLSAPPVALSSVSTAPPTVPLEPELPERDCRRSSSGRRGRVGLAAAGGAAAVVGAVPVAGAVRSVGVVTVPAAWPVAVTAVAGRSRPGRRRRRAERAAARSASRRPDVAATTLPARPRVAAAAFGAPTVTLSAGGSSLRTGEPSKAT